MICGMFDVERLEGTSKTGKNDKAISEGIEMSLIKADRTTIDTELRLYFRSRKWKCWRSSVVFAQFARFFKGRGDRW